MIPIIVSHLLQPRAPQKPLTRDDIVTNHGWTNEKYVVAEVSGDHALIKPLEKKGEMEWWPMVCLTFAGFLA